MMTERGGNGWWWFSEAAPRAVTDERQERNVFCVQLSSVPPSLPASHPSIQFHTIPPPQHRPSFRRQRNEGTLSPHTHQKAVSERGAEASVAAALTLLLPLLLLGALYGFALFRLLLHVAFRFDI